MKYFLFILGLYMACNEAFDLQTAFIGLGFMVVSGLFIAEKIEQLAK